MKKLVPLKYANRIINSGPVVLVSTSLNQRDNIITIAWNMPVSYSPICVAISSGTSRFTTNIIKETSEFVINVPNITLKQKVIECGSVSGKFVEKFKRFELTPISGKKVKSPAIKECIGHLECKLEKSIDVYDHIIFAGRVVKAYVDSDKWDFHNNVWIPDKAKILHHLGSDYFSTETSIE